MIDYALILTKNYSGSEWVMNGEEYSGIQWMSKTPKPTKAELDKQWDSVQFQVAYDNVSAARHAAYTASGGSDSIYMKYQRGEATKQEWLDAVNAINDAHPYPVKK